MISQSRYINIISGVGAGANVAIRQLILRLITQNTTLPPGVVAQFGNASSVGAYFGMMSEEYFRALAYFSFISKSIKSPSLISFARWVSTAIAPMVVGDTITKTIGMFTSVTAGTLTIVSGGTPVAIAAINLSTATNLTQVAALLQTAFALQNDTQIKNSTVTYNSNTNQFVMTGAVTGTGTLSVTPTGLSTDLSILLGWATGGTVLVAGQAADAPTVAISKSAGISNNFGSFAYCTPSVPLANSDIAAIAAWNHGQNNAYLYSVPTTLANGATLYALVAGYSGCGLTVISTTQANDYPEQSPCEILAATDYTATNAVQNYMWYQFPNRNTTVSDDNTANLADTSRLNYIGVTQSAGQPLAFYQRGVLCGGSTAAIDMNTYANEIWMKAAIASNLLSLFLNVPIVGADPNGQGMVISNIQSIIDKAKTNGVISIGKTLTNVQQQYITQITGDANAWRQVFTIGYWLSVTFQSITNSQSGLLEWQCNYTLIYSKRDAIRTVQGSDIMM